MESPAPLEEQPSHGHDPVAPEWPTIDEDLGPPQDEEIAWPVINAERTRKAIEGDAESRGAINAHLEMASAEELLDPAIEPLLNISSVREKYLFPAVAEAAKRSRAEGGLEPAESQLIKRTFELLGFERHQSKEIWGSWLAYNSGYDQTDQSLGRIPEGKKLGDTSPAKLDKFAAIVKAHLTRMEEINSQDPEALQVLFKRDHIRNFARYDSRDLLQQTQSNETPNRVVVTMAEDHNNATGAMRKSLYALKERRTRFVEAATKTEARQLLDEVASEAGPLPDVVFIVHSDEDQIVFSERPDGSVTRSDVMGTKGADPFLDNTVISRGGHMLIIGCDAGVKNGIAATMARKLHVRAQSPDIKSHGLERSGGRLKSIAEGGEASRALPVHGINPVRALALRVLARRKERQNVS